MKQIIRTSKSLNKLAAKIKNTNADSYLQGSCNGWEDLDFAKDFISLCLINKAIKSDKPIFLIHKDDQVFYFVGNQYEVAKKLNKVIKMEKQLYKINDWKYQ